MTSRCNSNPAQYERNRRFGHLVHALGRAAGGAKLPSVGLCLNASKAESRLVGADIHLESQQLPRCDLLRLSLELGGFVTAILADAIPPSGNRKKMSQGPLGGDYEPPDLKHGKHGKYEPMLT
ncbi:hypothetical protein J6590_099150 [Homalodisca vitripennis]|nr:hypothetical protein J6590_099150 [Homalodisca vitripennis]